MRIRWHPIAWQYSQESVRGVGRDDDRVAKKTVYTTMAAKRWGYGKGRLKTPRAFSNGGRGGVILYLVDVCHNSQGICQISVGPRHRLLVTTKPLARQNPKLPGSGVFWVPENFRH